MRTFSWFNFPVKYVAHNVAPAVTAILSVSPSADLQKDGFRSVSLFSMAKRRRILMNECWTGRQFLGRDRRLEAGRKRFVSHDDTTSF